MSKAHKRRRKKIPTVWESGIPIRIRPTGNKRFYSDIYHQGVRERLFHATEEEARKYCIKKAGEIGQQGASAIALSSRQRQDAERAIIALKGVTTLEAAVQFYMQHHVTGQKGIPCRAVVVDLLATKKAANRRPDTISDATIRLNKFLEAFGERPLGTITLHDLENWLAGMKVGPVSRLNYRTAVVGLFRYGIRRGLCDRNPAEALPRPGRDQTLPAIFTPKQVETLLQAVHARAPDMIPFFAIGLFAGLRPENELRCLDWGNIDFRTKVIRVDPATAKRRRTRFVKMSPNLVKWLTPHRTETGALHYSRRLFRAIVAAKDTPDWTPDVMRHTFATYHLVAHSDANATALELGHAGAPGVLFDHYRALARRKDATAFWSITPSARRVITFPKQKESIA